MSCVLWARLCVRVCMYVCMCVIGQDRTECHVMTGHHMTGHHHTSMAAALALATSMRDLCTSTCRLTACQKGPRMGR